MMDFMLEIAPSVPVPVLIGLAALSALSVVFAALRGLTGWWLRAAAALVLLVALLDPALKQEQSDPLNDVVFVVLDQSESQNIADRPAQMAQTRDALQQRLGALDNTDLVVVEVVNDTTDRDSGSLVLSALAKAASEVASSRIAGAIILSDGQVHDADLLTDFPAPVHLVMTGRQSDWDRRLIIKSAPAFAIVGEEILLALRIEDQGDVPAADAGIARISISVDGDNPQQFTVETGKDLELPLTLPHGGPNVLQFRVEPVAGELTDRNNNAVVSINGVRDRLRVLLVSGEPHAGERTWRNLLKSDSAVDLVHFTILRSPDKLDGVPIRELSLIAFPTRELFLEKIDEFDLIIFDRYRWRGILTSRYLENVADYVEKGGAVLLAPGPAFAGAQSIFRSPLGDVMPAHPTAGIIEEGYVPRISEAGQRHPVTEGLEHFAPRLPAEDGTPGWGRWMRQIDVDAVSGHTVMTGADDRPLLVLDRVGEGRIAMLMSDHAWLWTRGYEGGGPQLELLRRLAHWMMKEPDLEEERLSATASGGQVVLTRRSMSSEPRSIEVENPDGTKQVLTPTEVSPGHWQATFEGEENGLYRLSDGALSSVVALGPLAPREFEQTIADDALIAPLSKATRGGTLRIEDVPAPKIRLVREGRVAIGRDWLGLTPRNAAVVTDIRLSPVLPAWALMLAAGLLAFAAWRRESQ
jgi:hypothetical protein